jgi:hypothetical protein
MIPKYRLPHNTTTADEKWVRFYSVESFLNPSFFQRNKIALFLLAIDRYKKKE